MNKFSALIIDDEIDSVNLLKHFLAKFCLNINVVGHASSVEEGVLFINNQNPQILFLDIQLHKKNAFDLLDKIDFSEIEIIFITAYNEYALKAFKYNAVDYLLKPFSIEDLILATNKAINKIEEKNKFENFIDKKISIKNKNAEDFITISSMDKVILIKTVDIIFCKSDGRYTTFFLANNTEFVACKNLGEYENILSDQVFLRIHHSYIINVKYLISVIKKTGYYCEMTNNIFLPVAKRRIDTLKIFLNLNKQ